MPAAQRVVDFVHPLSDAGVNDLLGIEAGVESAEQLASGNDVQTPAQVREEPQDGKVAVGLGRKADQAVEPVEGPVEVEKVPLEGRVAVHVDRRARPFGDGPERDVLAIHLVAAVGEMVHRILRRLQAAARWRQSAADGAGRWWPDRDRNDQ